jgi:hypothetical protein
LRAAKSRGTIATSSSPGRTTPSRGRRRAVNDGPAYLDDFLPEVQVASDGYPYVLWYDWGRGETARIVRHVRCALDTAGRASRNQRVASAVTNWDHRARQHDAQSREHIGLFASGQFDGIAMAWGDGRLGDIDQFGPAPPANTRCPTAPERWRWSRRRPAEALHLSVTVANPNILFDNSYALTLTNSRAWSMVVPGGVDVAAGAGASVPFTLIVPDTAAAGLTQGATDPPPSTAAHTRRPASSIAVDRPVATLVVVVAASAAPVARTSSGR